MSQLHYYPSVEVCQRAMSEDEPLLVLISFDLQAVLVGTQDDYVEHHVLLARVGLSSLDIDKYFRIVLDKECASWTCVCPPDYKNIEDKHKRIAAFYKDGFAAIASATQQLGYYVSISIPSRYQRHVRALAEQ